jgi:hypothetical protein
VSGRSRYLCPNGEGRDASAYHTRSQSLQRAFARVIGPFLVIVPAIVAVRAPSANMGTILKAG